MENYISADLIVVDVAKADTISTSIEIPSDENELPTDKITADELLGGGEAETKTDQAEDLILDMLSSGEFVPAEKIFEKAKERTISQRTVNEAKLKNKSIVTKKIGKRWFWAIPDSAEETA